jgi:hypothetical protein
MEVGFTYTAWLDSNPIPTSNLVTVTQPDYHEISVARTEVASGKVANQLVRFIVAASERNGTELGLPPQTPLPVINSSSNELAGARLRFLAPDEYPRDLAVPIIAFLENSDGHAVRANGLLKAAGHPDIQIRRGVGSGLLAPDHSADPLNYVADLPGLQINKIIRLESNTTWSAASEILNSDVTWPENSRIHITTNLTITAGSTLTIGAGTIVRLNSHADITLNGKLVINGTSEHPVVFTPNSQTEPWGGFMLRTSASELIASGTIFTGSGADPNWFPKNGFSSHRNEQCLFFLEMTPRVSLTNCAMIDLAGQLGHATTGGSVNFTRCLVQRCTTGGEYTGASFHVNDSAFIECPADTSAFVDGDNDGLYLVSGTHGFTNTLFGWTKDDGIDAGASGAGLVEIENCWFESIFHEGMALSGTGKNVRIRNTVFLDCGQAYECGYEGPDVFADHCLSLANKSGARFGDNYPNIGLYTGFLRVTNSILIYNHRDIFGRTWRANKWTNELAQMDLRGNLLTTADTNHPQNTVWDPSKDAARLASFQNAPIGHVGIALAVRPGQTSLANFPEGLPVALSSFCTNEVSVDYILEGSDGTISGGTLDFIPGETRKFISVPHSDGVLRLGLTRAQNADLTGPSSTYLQNLPSSVPLDRLSIARFGGEAVVYWADPTFTLEEADAAPGPWRQSVTAKSPSAVVATGNKFFRLRR